MEEREEQKVRVGETLALHPESFFFEGTLLRKQRVYRTEGWGLPPPWKDSQSHTSDGAGIHSPSRREETQAAHRLSDFHEQSSSRQS
jgi:hypothetical protein